MRLPRSLSFGAALLGASLLVGPASAASVAGAASRDFSNANPAPSYVQLAQAGPHMGPQRAGGGRHGGGHRGGYRGGSRGYGYRGGHYRGRNDGDWAGGAAAGAALGLFLGAVIANQAQRQDAVGYCMQRYRSYDPQSMTYLGYDGARHPCP